MLPFSIKYLFSFWGKKPMKVFNLWASCSQLANGGKGASDFYTRCQQYTSFAHFPCTSGVCEARQSWWTMLRHVIDIFGDKSTNYWWTWPIGFWDIQRYLGTSVHYVTCVPVNRDRSWVMQWFTVEEMNFSGSMHHNFCFGYGHKLFSQHR